MRLIYAGLFILAGVLGEMVFVNRMYPETSGSTQGKLLGATIAVLIVAAYFLFNERSPWVIKHGVVTYARRGELVSDTLHARRALELRDPEGQDTWYLLELENGKVLCLWDNLASGPLGFDPTRPQVRRFPSTEFTVFRHASENFTVEVVCAGEVIKPLVLMLPRHSEEWRISFLPKDGDIIPNKGFDEVKAEVLQASRGLIKS